MGTVSLKWIDSTLMVGADSAGNTLVMGHWSEQHPEWSGLKPSDLLLLSVASCTAYDVVLILKKQREPLEGLEISVTGEQDPDPPFAFRHIHIHYKVYGECNIEKVARALQLSEEKYCSVINTIRPAVDISSDFELVNIGRI